MKNKTIFEATLGHAFDGKKYPLFIFDTYIKGDVGTRNWHSTIELYYILTGSCEILYDTEYLHVKENEFCIINSNVIHSLKSESGVRILNIGISTDFCNFCGLDIEQFSFEKIFSDKQLTKKILSLSKIYFESSTDKLYNVKLSSKLLDFCIHIVSKHARYHSAINSSDPIQLAIGYIKANLDKKITLDDIANQAGFSKYYLSRKFKEVCGITTTKYINTLRCHQACIYFQTTDLSINDVYNKLYFGSYEYFLTVFKKIVGCTITEYVSKLSKNNDTLKS